MHVAQAWLRFSVFENIVFLHMWMNKETFKQLSSIKTKTISVVITSNKQT